MFDLVNVFDVFLPQLLRCALAGGRAAGGANFVTPIAARVTRAVWGVMNMCESDAQSLRARARAYRYPNPADPLNVEAAALLNRDAAAYAARVRGALRSHARARSPLCLRACVLRPPDSRTHTRARGVALALTCALALPLAQTTC